MAPNGQSSATEMWPQAYRLAHLGGGMRASNPPGEKVEFFPRLPNTPRGFSLAQYSHLHASLVQGGLTMIGVDFMTYPDQALGIRPCDWLPFWPTSGHISADAEALWSQLAMGAHKKDNYELVDICRRILFQIRASSRRLHDISDAYHQELRGRIREDEFKDGQLFESMNSFMISISTHSFLAEMATLRDYLAEFIAKHILHAFNPGNINIRLMKHLGQKIIPAAMEKHPLADIIAVARQDGGWLKTLSAYRDLAVHYTPLASASHRGMMEQHVLQLPGSGQFPIIRFPLPADPDEIKRIRSEKSLQDWLRQRFSDPFARAKGPDALEYSHQSLGIMAAFAQQVGSYAPVKPEMFNLGDEDFIGPLTIRRG